MLNEKPDQKKIEKKPIILEIVQEEKNGIGCVTVKGLGKAELEFKNTIKKIMEGDKKRLILDLGALYYLPSNPWSLMDSRLQFFTSEFLISL